MTSGYSISLIRDPARETSQLYLRVAWTSPFKQVFLFWRRAWGGREGWKQTFFSRYTISLMRSLRSHACQNHRKEKMKKNRRPGRKIWPKAAMENRVRSGYEIRLRFPLPLQFNSSQGHLDCHLFQIWNMTRLSKMSRVLGNDAVWLLIPKEKIWNGWLCVR